MPPQHVTALKFPSTTTALQQWLLLSLFCPARRTFPGKFCFYAAIDLIKCCCKRSLAVWAIIRMNLRFIEVHLLRGKGYLSEFRGSSFVWWQAYADPQSWAFYFSSSRLFLSWRLGGQSPLKKKNTKKNPTKQQHPDQKLRKLQTLIKINN